MEPLSTLEYIILLQKILNKGFTTVKLKHRKSLL